MYDDEKLQEKIRKIIETNKPASIEYDGKISYIGKRKIAEIKEAEHWGGILPLEALLPLIFGGISAGAGAAGEKKTAVKNYKESKKLDAEIEKLKTPKAVADAPEIKTGQGIYLDSYQGYGICDFNNRLPSEQSEINEEIIYPTFQERKI